MRTKSFTVLYLKASPPSSIAVEKENAGGRGGEQWLSTPLMTCSTQRSALLLPAKQWGEMIQHWNTIKPGSAATESVVTVVEYILPHNNSYEKRRKRGRERRKKLHCLLLAWYGYEIVTLCDLNEENVSLQTVLWEYCAFVTFLHSNLTHKALHLYKKSYINVRHAYVNYPNRII